MIPAAGPAHLDDMNRELFSGLGQAHQLFRAARRTRDRPQAVAVDPGYESELFLPADRACDLAPPTVKFGRTQQVGIGVTYLGDIDTARIDVSQQRLAPERIVHHLPLNSHAPRVAVLYCCRPRPDWIRVDGVVETAAAARTGSTSSGTSEVWAESGLGAVVRAGVGSRQRHWRICANGFRAGGPIQWPSPQSETEIVPRSPAQRRIRWCRQ